MPKKLDLTGNQYGQLKVLRRVPGNSRYLTWECQCVCGKTLCVTSNKLRNGSIISCGCIKKRNGHKRSGIKTKDLRGRAIDITGRRYGKLTALKPTDKRSKAGSVIWRCRCDCGKETEVAVAELNKENCKSCGCLMEEYQKLLHDRLHLVDGTCVEWLEGRKNRSDNSSGFRGVFRKKNGKYSVSIGFKKKIYYIGIFDTYEEAVEARREAEEYIFKGFLTAHKTWESMAEQDPDWASENPFLFEVSKENGRLVVHNSVEQFIPKRMKSFSENLNNRAPLIVQYAEQHVGVDADGEMFTPSSNVEETKEQEQVHI